MGRAALAAAQRAAVKKRPKARKRAKVAAKKKQAAGKNEKGAKSAKEDVMKVAAARISRRNDKMTAVRLTGSHRAYTEPQTRARTGRNRNAGRCE